MKRFFNCFNFQVTNGSIFFFFLPNYVAFLNLRLHLSLFEYRNLIHLSQILILVLIKPEFHAKSIRNKYYCYHYYLTHEANCIGTWLSIYLGRIGIETGSGMDSTWSRIYQHPVVDHFRIAEAGFTFSISIYIRAGQACKMNQKWF